MKWSYFVRQVTTVIIVVFPLELGKKVMRSIAISSTTSSEIGRG